MKDFLREISDRFLAAALRAELPMEAMERLEREWKREEAAVRQEVGGDRVYIQKPARADEAKKARVVQDYLASDAPVQDVANRHGVSRRTLYNYLKK